MNFKQFKDSIFLPWALVAAGVILLVISGFIWVNDVFESPSTVFYDAIKNTMATTSVAKHQTASANGQSVEGRVNLKFGKNFLVDETITKKSGKATLTTESIVTPKASYLSYKNFKSGEKNGPDKSYQPLLNKWGRTTQKPQYYYDQAVLSESLSVPFPPVGDLSAEHQANLLKFIKDNRVFTTDFSKVKHEKVNGVNAYVYQVNVELAPYVQYVQNFARDMGSNYLDKLDPSQYENAAPVSVSFYVDPGTHRLIKASYPTGHYSETFSAYGQAVKVNVPKNTISLDKLEASLAKVESQSQGVAPK